MTPAEVKEFVRNNYAHLEKLVLRDLSPLQARLEAAEARAKELEDRLKRLEDHFLRRAGR